MLSSAPCIIKHSTAGLPSHTRRLPLRESHCLYAPLERENKRVSERERVIWSKREAERDRGRTQKGVRARENESEWKQESDKEVARERERKGRAGGRDEVRVRREMRCS